FEAGIRTVDLSADTNATGTNIINVAAETGAANGYTLIGSSGIDAITGGSGADTITGGGGQDTLHGGGGNDTFVLDGNTTASYDVIDDFASANDTLSLVNFALANQSGTGAISQIQTVTSTGVGGSTIANADLVIYNITANNVDTGTEVDNLLASQNGTFNGGV